MLHRWYLGDGVVVTKAGEAEALLQHLLREVPKVGLTVNLAQTTTRGPGSKTVESPTLATVTRLPHTQPRPSC